MRLAPCLAVLLAGLTRLSPAAAQPSPSAPTLRWSTGELNPTRALVGLDDDDDDDDGVPDSQQSPAPPADDDRVALSLEGIPTGAVAVTVTGGLRVRDPSGGLVERANLPVRRGAATR